MELWIHKEPGDVTIPIYDTRLALVKLLLELGMFEHAFTVLENLQKENDEVVDLWYLYGWTYYCLGDDEERTQEKRITLWGDARDCLETAVKLFQMIGSDDEAMFEHSKELLQIINQVVPETVEEEEEVNEELEIESDGDEDIRIERKNLVKQAEMMLETLDEYRQREWERVSSGSSSEDEFIDIEPLL
ncbi:hypothetical protein G6F68_012974 [Rhizopus microsporus]|nr:hypothetical protein G6F68_012974 [Rhizopus microsporus]